MNDHTALPPPSKRHRTLAQDVIDYVSKLIRERPIAVGEKLPTELEIMQAVGVSRSVVREAISHMQSSGVVEARQGIGTFVIEPSQTVMGLDPKTVITMHDVLSVLELRISLETEAAGLAAQRRSEPQLAQVRASPPGAPARAAPPRADTAFHLAIAQASGNRFLYDVLNHLGSNIMPRARASSAKLKRDAPAVFIERVIREHEDIFDAIARQDSESARAAMRTHLSNSRERLRRAYEQYEASQA
jgi:GntR family transcriptional repressor for pyruvate dehydrogenase complex